MDNLKLPAYPFAWEGKEDVDHKTIVPIITHTQSGFTKLELASLMIAQGLIASDPQGLLKKESIATFSVEYAKAVLEEANN